MYIVSMDRSCIHSQERDEKLLRHQPSQKAAGAATRGTATAGPMVTVSRDSKAAARGEAISRGAAIATNGGLPGDILVRKLSASVHRVVAVLRYTVCTCTLVEIDHTLSECNCG